MHKSHKNKALPMCDFCAFCGLFSVSIFPTTDEEKILTQAATTTQHPCPDDGVRVQNDDPRQPHDSALPLQDHPGQEPHT